MNLELLKLCEFYTHPDDEFDTIGPLDVTTVWTDELRRLFVVTWWYSTGVGRSLARRYFTNYPDAINACLDRSGWGSFNEMVQWAKEDDPNV